MVPRSVRCPNGLGSLRDLIVHRAPQRKRVSSRVPLIPMVAISQPPLIILMPSAVGKSHAGAPLRQEVDFVLENSAGEIVGIEVKSAASVTRRDFLGLERVASVAGSAFKQGIVLYDGVQTLSFADNLRAVPLYQRYEPDGVRGVLLSTDGGPPLKGCRPGAVSRKGGKS